MFLKFFNKNSFVKVQNFFDHTSQQIRTEHYNWMALTINQKSFKNSPLTKEIALSGIDETAALQIAQTKKGPWLRGIQNNKVFYEASLRNPEEARAFQHNFNALFDLHLEKEINHFIQGFQKADFSPEQLKAEDKSLEWIRVSFEVLTKGIIESFTNQDLLFQTTFFSGINPQTKKREMRLITFNLDMTFILLDDLNLRVIIYNKKNSESLEGLTPALIGDYSFRKREIFDHLIELLSVLSKGIKF